jgi:phosphoglycerol transferase MdoB-like AlkP superfamily enzyme
MGDREHPMSLSVPSDVIAQDFSARRSNTKSTTQSNVLVDDNVRAVAAALTLCAFLWGIKGYLIVWYFHVKHINPFADAPFDGMLAVGGADLFFCACLAGVYRAMFALAPRIHQSIAWLLRTPGTYLVHAAVVIFSVASFQVTQIYGGPLEVQHLRSADDPKIIASSISAYSGLVPLLLILIGLAMRPALGYVLETSLGRVRARSPKPWPLWGGLAVASVLLFGAWTVRLHGIDTFGVKHNSVVYFLQHYKSAPGPIEVRATMQELSHELGEDKAGNKPHLDDVKSLSDADGVLRRDFPFAADARGMNVLVIQLESTSASYLDEKTTPNLMRLAAHGLSFRNHATVFTETTRATYGIYYSDYMLDLGTTPRMLYGKRLPQPCLPEILHDAGYQTALFHSGFLTYAEQDYLFQNKGMDKIVDAKDLWVPGTTLPWSWGVREEQTVDALTSWLSHREKSGNTVKPFFAIYATEFPHHPYDCPTDDKPYAETGWLNRYRNSLHYADSAVGRLIDNLAAMNLLDNTLIAVMGDHGETVSTYPVGHGLALTREEVFTPFILSNPRLFPAPLSSRLTTNHLDIAPTVATLVGVKPPPQWLGRNLLAEEIPARVLFIQAKLAQIHGVVDNGLVYVYETSRHRGQLFDTSSGGFTPVSGSDTRASGLMSGYLALDETFQKWAVWRHLARASGQLEEPSPPHTGPAPRRLRNASAND